MRNLFLGCLNTFLIIVLLLVSPTKRLTAKPKQTIEKTGLHWKLERNSQGLLTSLTDPANKTTNLSYEFHPNKRLKKLTRELSDGSKVIQSFDRYGRRTSMTDQAGTVKYGYDRYGRLNRVERKGQPTISYTHDTMGRVTSKTIGDKWKIGYTYDFLGRLAVMSTPIGKITWRYHLKSGRVRRTLPNGIQTVWSYQSGGRLASIVHAAKDRKILLSFTYAYRPDGRIREIKEWSPKGEKTVGYDYDTSHRLSKVVDSVLGTTTYKYDELGNRLEVKRGDKKTASEYDWANQLIKHNGQQCRHDKAGNLLEYTGPEGKRALTYTVENQLASVKTSNGTVEYGYDGEGNLIRRNAGKEKTTFVPDPLSNIWRPLMSRETTKSTYYIWDGNVPLLSVEKDKVRYFLHNHQGSVEGIAEKKGDVSRLTYSAFGMSQEMNRWQPGFAGLFFDPTAKLYLTRARGLDPAMGRFLQTDPIHRLPMGSQNDFSSYVYCGNDPIQFVDQDGAARKRFWQREAFGFTSLFPRIISQSEWGFPLTYYGNYAGANRAPLEGLKSQNKFGTSDAGLQRFYQTNKKSLNLPDILDAVDLAAFRHDARLEQLRIVDPSAGFASLHKWEVGKIHLQLAKDLRTAVYSPDTTLTGRVFASFAAPVFEQMGGLSALITTAHSAAKKIKQSFANSKGRTKSFGNLLNNGNVVGLPPPPPPPGGGLSNIGGISLKGAAEALKDLGALQGVMIDENGRLVLLAEEQGKVKLPPLSLDDVVAIFRSVYGTPKGPFVSIDPDPKNPKGSKMHIRLPKELRQTHAGFVLFEADRVMKVYSLGHSNLSGRQSRSRIPGYKSLFDFNGGNKDVWERFWIRPKQATRKQSSQHRLTLLDVSLQLQTEPMVMGANGKLSPAPKAKTSPGARYFTQWFTKNFDAIAKEARVRRMPVMPKSVAIFQELRRLTLITAIAESLKDQGVPLPSWMRDYKVKPFKFRETTPGKIFSAKGKKIYGGARTSPETVKKVEATKEQIQIATTVKAQIQTTPSLKPITVKVGRKKYRVVALPGSETKTYGACRLTETDLTVPITDSTSLSFARSYNSLLSTSGHLGRKWTLNLPRMVKRFVRSDQKDKVRIGMEILHPLNPPSKLHFSFVRGKHQGQTTYGLPMANGRGYFAETGELLTLETEEMTLSYHRDEQKRLTRIEGKVGSRKASIAFTYNKAGLLTKVSSHNGKDVSFTYNEAGELIDLKRPSHKLTYRYEKGLLTSILRNGKAHRSFEYADGRLVSETLADGKVLTYQAKRTEKGLTITVNEKGKKSTEVYEYDHAMRPLRQSLADGARLQWAYPKSGAKELTITLAEGDRYHIKRSADGKTETWNRPEGGVVTTHRDKNGRVAKVMHGDQVALEQTHNSSGEVVRARYETVEILPRRENGKLTGVYLRAPGEQGSTQWLKMELDAEKRPVKITDYSGSTISIKHKEKGWSEITSDRGTVKLKKNARGQIEELIESSKRSQKWEHDKSGQLTRATITEGKEKAIVTFKAGKPIRIVNFDGGAFAIAYKKSRTGSMLKSIQAPNGVTLKYEHRGKRVKSITCGTRYRLEYQHDEKGRLIGLSQVPIQK